MRPEERDAAYLWDMLQAAREVASMLGRRSLPAFLKDRVRVRALERSIELVGEAARRVSTSFREAHPEIPWRQLIGQRNILAPEYGQVDHALLYNTAINDIPELIVLLENLLPPIEAG
jgi:uncharacterized protein with HEPN domain